MGAIPDSFNPNPRYITYRLVEGGDGSLGMGAFGVGDEGETARATILIHDHVALDNLTKLAESLHDVLLHGIPADVADIALCLLLSGGDGGLLESGGLLGGGLLTLWLINPATSAQLRKPCEHGERNHDKRGY